MSVRFWWQTGIACVHAALRIFKQTLGPKMIPAIAAAALVGVGGGSFATTFALLSLNQNKVARHDLLMLSNATALYMNDHDGHGPAHLIDLSPMYLHGMHRDPWGHDYFLAHPPGALIIGSLGADGRLGGDDDLIQRIELKSDDAQAENLLIDANGCWGHACTRDFCGPDNCQHEGKHQ
ncbi:MAG: type II secretion system protein GspG [Deltaproteobacteria bacterium]|nr:type II secretion system protein GspG [Deltaproteobacteria bacterium]